MTLDTIDTGVDGNTKSSTPVKKIRSRYWIFTWNNYTLDDKKYVHAYIDKCEKGACNEEMGENGTPHLQFFIALKNARYFSTIKKDFPKCHIEKARNIDACMDYCQKKETQLSEPYVKDNIRKVKDPLDGKQLYDWQLWLKNYCEKDPDERKIIWRWDRFGCCGKTSLAKHLCLTFPNEVLYLSGKSSDIKFGIKSFLDESKNNLRIAIFDFTRSTENFISYEGIESVKNGIFYNSKYESGMVLFDPPHIICFANFEPEKNKLSLDRWDIEEINADNSDGSLYIEI